MRARRVLDHFQPSDVRGIAQLATLATVEVTRIVEGVHQSVWNTLGAPGGVAPGTTRGLTGMVYRSVRGVTCLVGQGVDGALSVLQPAMDAIAEDRPGTPHRDTVLAALNGVMGDRLLDAGSTFAIPMTVRNRGVPIGPDETPPDAHATGKILLLIHGLCMTDHHWHTRRVDRVVDHGDALASSLGYTPVHLRYNSGLHVSDNGRELASRLEQLVAHWPNPVEELTVVAHSMGGLLIRSACDVARRQRLRWLERLRNIVFLGTPHHGAPLEQAGNTVDAVLESTPYTAPFARLGRLRSAGITDLRYGTVSDEDRPDLGRRRCARDRPRVVSLPADVACFAVAATTAARRGPLADRLVGDGLVPLASALGTHDDRRRSLDIPQASQRVVYRTSHLGLLSSPDVTRQLIRWLRPTGAARGAW